MRETNDIDWFWQYYLINVLEASVLKIYSLLKYPYALDT